MNVEKEFVRLVGSEWTEREAQELLAHTQETVEFVKCLVVLQNVTDKVLEKVTYHLALVNALRFVANDIEQTLGGQDEA